MKDSNLTFIYLHGLDSSGQAEKAQLLGQYIKKHRLAINYLQPDLDNLPDRAMLQIESLLDSLRDEKVVLIGSSLGGFYATHLSQTRKLPAILVNPAVRPHELMHKYIGDHENPYTKVQYRLTTAHMDTLKSFYHETITDPKQLLILLQMGDEVLNAIEASRHFSACQCIIAPGGDHRFQGFSNYIKLIIDWLLSID